MQVGTGFHLHGNDVGAGIGEVGDVVLRLHDHQVHVEGLARNRSQGLHDQGTDRDVGHEAAVHYVNVNPVSACLVDGTHVFAKTGEIGGEDRWRDHQGLGAHAEMTDAASLIVGSCWEGHRH